MAQHVLVQLSTYPHIMTGQERPVGVKSRQKNQRLPLALLGVQEDHQAAQA